MEETKKVKVYTKDNCYQCNLTKEVLERGNVDFELINVMYNEEAYNYVKNELGFSSAPVVEAEGFDTFAGFQPDKLEEIVEKLAEGN